jgi:hypothetical protein
MSLPKRGFVDAAVTTSATDTDSSPRKKRKAIGSPLPVDQEANEAKEVQETKQAKKAQETNDEKKEPHLDTDRARSSAQDSKLSKPKDPVLAALTDVVSGVLKFEGMTADIVRLIVSLAKGDLVLYLDRTLVDAMVAHLEWNSWSRVGRRCGRDEDTCHCNICDLDEHILYWCCGLMGTCEMMESWDASTGTQACDDDINSEQPDDDSEQPDDDSEPDVRYHRKDCKVAQGILAGSFPADFEVSTTDLGELGWIHPEPWKLNDVQCHKCGQSYKRKSQLRRQHHVIYTVTRMDEDGKAEQLEYCHECAPVVRAAAERNKPLAIAFAA